MSSLHRRRIAFTSPASYGEFLRSRLDVAGAIPIWVPTIKIEFSDRTRTNVRQAIAEELHRVSGIAFTSRNGIRAVAEQFSEINLPEIQNPFYLGALGRDADALASLERLTEHSHCQVVCPAITTPQALVMAMGAGQGRTLLCPVPEVIGLPEPPVVPTFLSALAEQSWVPIRINAYETLPAKLDNIETLISQQVTEKVEAIIFTSTAEAIALVNNVQALGVDLSMLLQNVVVAVHGPVTAEGVRSLNIKVDVVSQDSSSFSGVVKALQKHWSTST